MNKTYILYKAISPSNKIYIGITSMSLKDRIYGHYSSAKVNKRPFCVALIKYGKNIKWEVVEKNLNKEQAEKLEKSLILQYKSFDRQFGYNLSLGGLSGYIQSKEGKKRIGLTSKKRLNTQELRNKQTEHLFHKKIRNKAREEQKKYFQSDRHKQSIKNRKKRVFTREQLVSQAIKIGAKPFICNETGEKFILLSDAAKKYGLDKRCIHSILKQKRKTIKGFSFKYI